MFSKLAFKNVTKSIKDFTIYFLTMTFGVCLFYMFNSIDSQAAMMQLNSTQGESIQMLSHVIGMVSIFISVILGFLIVYANRFLIKRRKKELGLYMTLGMEKSKISGIILLETLFIGIFSLAVGLVIGIFASQGLSVVTAKLFEVNLKSFQFTFSFDAFYKTLIYFGIIFLIVIIFNAIAISRFKLIDLLTAGKKNENLKIKHLWVSVIIFLASVICLATAYYLIIKNGMMQWNGAFLASIILGSVGTLLFFLSLSGFLLRVVQTNKRLYFKNLNMFVLRQINSKINTTFVSMTVICLMLLITIGTLSTGMGLADVLSKGVRSSTPYDVTFTLVKNEDDPKTEAVVDLAKELTDDKIDLQTYAKDYAQINYYESPLKMETFDIDKSLLLQYVGTEEGVKKAQQYPINAIPVSSFNRMAQMQGKPKIILKENEFAVNCTFWQFEPSINTFLQNTGTITINGKKLSAAHKTVTQVCLQTSMTESDSGTIIVPDDMIKGMPLAVQVLNLNYKPGTNGQKFLDQLKTVYNDADVKSKKISYPYDMVISKQSIYDQSAGLKVVISYLAIYIGLVFLITSAAVLALQQLSEASDNAERYGLLKKLGAEEKMIRHALFTQIGIYFFIPLFLAVIHSIVGVQVANNVVTLLGHLDIASNTLFTAAIFLIIYGAYFLATYFGSKSIIQSRKNDRV